jgi:membrane protein insertase Oxa1/YidC/SpoIIIJ
MEAEVINASTNAILNIERVGVVGILVLVIAILLIYIRRDTSGKEIAERQAVATEKMAEVQKVHNDFMQKYMEEQGSLLRVISERQIEIKSSLTKSRRSA